MTAETRYIATLICGHSQEVLHGSTGDYYCWTCQRMRTTIKVSPIFRARCFNCRYARNYGAAEFAATRGSRGHSLRFPLHHVWLYRAGEKWKDYSPRNIIELELGDDPPFWKGYRTVTNLSEFRMNVAASYLLLLIYGVVTGFPRISTSITGGSLPNESDNENHSQQGKIIWVQDHLDDQGIGWFA